MIIMRKLISLILFISILASSITMQSCKEEYYYTLILVQGIEMFEGDHKKIEISSGNGGYKVESTNENVVQVNLKGSIIGLLGIDEGVADILVSDATGQKETIKVRVGIIPQYIEGDLSISLRHFGLELKADVNDITGDVLFSILPTTCDKLVKSGHRSEIPLLSSEIRSMINGEESKESLDFIYRPNDLLLKYSFGVLDEGTCYYFVDLDFSKVDVIETEDGNISVIAKGLCTYVQDRGVPDSLP